MKNYKTIQINGVQVRLHRHIMEVSLGRPLNSDEIVHHVNGDKHDNRIENLQVVSRGDHIRMHPEIHKMSMDKILLKIDTESILVMYESMTIKQIAAKLNVSPMTVWYRLKKAGAKTNKLDKNDIDRINEMIRDGVRQKEIARHYNVSYQLINDIKNKRRYAKYSNNG